MPQKRIIPIANWTLERYFVGTFNDPEYEHEYRTEMCHIKCRRCGIRKTVPYNTYEENICECATMTPEKFEYHKKRLDKMKMSKIKPPTRTSRVKKAS